MTILSDEIQRHFLLVLELTNVSTEKRKKIAFEETEIILKDIEKRIDLIDHIKPANKPEDVIYNTGYKDGIGKVKEMLLK